MQPKKVKGRSSPEGMGPARSFASGGGRLQEN
jgi:hypothetical protein